MGDRLFVTREGLSAYGKKRKASRNTVVFREIGRNSL